MVMLVVLLMFVLAVPVLAARVETETWSVDYEYTLIEDCGAYGEGWNFAIKDIEVGSGVDRLRYNNDDELVKVVGHVRGTDTVYREGFPENVVTADYAINGHFNLVTGEDKFTGNTWNLHLPGVGNVFHIAGSEFYQDGEFVRSAGLEHVDFEAICRYFAD
jgi:hypothetical protein